MGRESTARVPLGLVSITVRGRGMDQKTAAAKASALAEKAKTMLEKIPFSARALAPEMVREAEQVTAELRQLAEQLRGG